MEEKFKESFKQATAFQKMWMDSMSGMTKVWSEYSPQNPPPDELKKVRNGVLKAVSQTWEEYMRTPEFMEAMKETMGNTMQWQKLAKENTNKMHSAMGSATKDDIQGVMVALQHVERRVLDCLDGMQSKMTGMQADMDEAQIAGAKALAGYQEKIMKRLAEMEKAMKATAAKPAPQPAVAKPAAKTVPAKPKPATKVAAKKPAPAKKAVAKKAPAPKAKAKKAAPVKKVVAKKPAPAKKKAVAKKAPAKKAPVKKVVAKKAAKKAVKSKTSKAKK